MYICIYTYLYIHTYIYIYIHIYIFCLRTVGPLSLGYIFTASAGAKSRAVLTHDVPVPKRIAAGLHFTAWRLEPSESAVVDAPRLHMHAAYACLPPTSRSHPPRPVELFIPAAREWDVRWNSWIYDLYKLQLKHRWFTLPLTKWGLGRDPRCYASLHSDSG